MPTRDASGVYSSSVVVDDGVDIYFSMTAYDSANVSSFSSNEICRGASGACAPLGGGGVITDPPDIDPDPTTPPDGGGGSTGPLAQITGFRLWDARTDTIIDNSFVSGKTIPATQYDCVAIEIVGNSYLNTSGKGSVRKELDANTGTSCTSAGVTHENSPPFAWEADEGPGKFACSASLRVGGTHTLRVTPYDGADCTGNVGTTQVLQFQVLSIGQPGRPTLVP